MRSTNLNFLFFSVLIFSIAYISFGVQLRKDQSTFFIEANNSTDSNTTSSSNSTGSNNNSNQTRTSSLTSSTTQDNNTMTYAQACEKLAAYISTWREVTDEINSLIKRFKAHVEMYKKWEKDAITKEDREVLLQKEKRMLEVYIVDCLTIDTLYKKALSMKEEFEQKRCVEQQTQNTTSVAASEQGSVTLAQVVTMLVDRMHEINMIPSNKQFLQVSYEVLGHKAF